MAAPVNSEVGLLDQKRLFDCSNAIEPLPCSHCKNFETHKLVGLMHHFRRDHAQSEENFNSSSPSFKQIYNDHDYCSFDSVLGKKSILFKCRHCPYVTKRQNYLKHHILRQHTDPIQVQWFECDQCPYRSQKKSNLNKHSYFVHHYTRKYECDFCRFETTVKYMLRSHILLKHTLSDVQWYECEHCLYRSKRKGNLQRHMETAHSEKEHLKCDEPENAQSEGHCNFQTTVNYPFLQDHNYCSVELGLDMKSRMILDNLHGHTFPAEMQWSEPDHCSFERNANKHRKKKYKCYNCEYESNFKWVLKSHIFHKHGKLETIQWFGCEHCPYRSKFKGNLKSHRDNIHGEKETLKCDSCPYQTKYKQALQRHVIVKHTELKSSQWLYCEQCTYKTKVKAYLQVHQSKRHRTRSDKK